MLTILRQKDFDTIVCVTGDHTTPVKYGDHSHEPVPFVIGSAKTTNLNTALRFDEVHCAQGRFGRVTGDQLIPLMI
jgi:2,3-bisphosphoglycerate-independent phosphoglycerate mutase